MEMMTRKNSTDDCGNPVSATGRVPWAPAVAGMLMTLCFGWGTPAEAATYEVSSQLCTGAGSLQAAITAANTNPGPDVISFTPGLQVEVSTCPGSPTSFFASVADDVTFEGNGAKLMGHIQWITTGGLDTPLDGCPRPSDIITGMTPGFLKVADNISVVVKNLSVREVHGIAEVGNNASLVLEDFKAERVLAFFKDCNQNAVAVGANSNLTLRRNDWRRVVRWGLFNPPTLTTPAIFSFAAGNLVIEDSSFRDLGTSKGQSSGLVFWNGAAGSTAKIVSTRMQKTGGIVMSGDVTSYIVNSVWATDPVGDPDLGDRIVNDSSGEMTIAGSTIVSGGVGCGSRCFDPQAGIDANGLLRVWDDGSKINLVDTGIGVLFDSIPGKVLNDAAFNGPPRPGKITANDRTWIQPGNGQDAADLKTVTGQPNLLTDPPGLMRDDLSFDLAELASPLLGTPGNPGRLIDVIAGGCTSDKLVNPIDGSDIVTDAFGNPRCDANGTRNIGAVQLTLSPSLSVTAVGDGSVDLSWTRPKDPSSGAITGYGVFYRPVGGTSFKRVDVVGADVRSAQIAGLTNGKTYEFYVVGVNNAGDGPPSNTVTGRPHGDIGTVNRTPVYSQSAVHQANQPKYWEALGYGSCVKYEVDSGFGSVWTLDALASSLILKSGTTNDVWRTSLPGMYGTPSAKDISHAIVCYAQ